MHAKLLPVIGNASARRSAYSKPGGAEPLCYERDVPKLRLRVERIPFPGVSCGMIRFRLWTIMFVVGSPALRIFDREWGEIAAEPPVRYRPAACESVSTP